MQDEFCQKQNEVQAKNTKQKIMSQKRTDLQQQQHSL